MISSHIILILVFQGTMSEEFFLPIVTRRAHRSVTKNLARNATHVHNSYRGLPSRSTDTKSNSLFNAGICDFQKRYLRADNFARPLARIRISRAASCATSRFLTHMLEYCRVQIFCIGLSVGRRILEIELRRSSAVGAAVNSLSLQEFLRYLWDESIRWGDLENWCARGALHHPPGMSVSESFSFRGRACVRACVLLFCSAQTHLQLQICTSA